MTLVLITTSPLAPMYLQHVHVPCMEKRDGSPLVFDMSIFHPFLTGVDMFN